MGWTSWTGLPLQQTIPCCSAPLLYHPSYVCCLTPTRPSLSTQHHTPRVWWWVGSGGRGLAPSGRGPQNIPVRAILTLYAPVSTSWGAVYWPKYPIWVIIPKGLGHHGRGWTWYTGCPSRPILPSSPSSLLLMRVPLWGHHPRP